MLIRVSLALTFTASLMLAQSPVILGIENNGNGSTTGVPAGTLISIFGSQLASSTAQASSIPLSSSLADSSVTINNVAAPLYFVTPGVPGSVPAQINAQVPFNVLPPGTSGSVNVVVTNNGNPSPPFSLTINQFAPAVYTINGSGSGYSIAYFGLASDPRFGHFVAPPGTFPGITTFAANTGDVLTIYATGLGAVNPQVASGASPNPNNPSLTATTPTVFIGNIPATFFGAALTQYPGVYQLNVQVPPGVTPGNSVPLQIQIGGITSSTSTVIAVGSQ